VQACRKLRDEAEIVREGDVLTIVVQRENVNTPGGGIYSRSRFGSDRDLELDPLDNLKATVKHTLSFYKNGEDMGLHLQNLVGPFYLCLNYYFVESEVRVLSDYNFRKINHKWLRLQSRRVQEQDSEEAKREGYKSITSEVFI